MFQTLDSETNGFMPAETAGQQEREKRTISLALQSFTVWGLRQCKALLRGEPVADAHAQIPDAFDSANTRGQIGAQQTGVGCLIGEVER